MTIAKMAIDITNDLNLNQFTWLISPLGVDEKVINVSLITRPKPFPINVWVAIK